MVRRFEQAFKVNTLMPGGNKRSYHMYLKKPAAKNVTFFSAPGKC